MTQVISASGYASATSATAGNVWTTSPSELGLMTRMDFKLQISNCRLKQRRDDDFDLFQLAIGNLKFAIRYLPSASRSASNGGNPPLRIFFCATSSGYLTRRSSTPSFSTSKTQ